MRKKYKRIWINGKIIPFHRYAVEQAIGRKLTHNEHVHHIDGNSMNNALSNLQIVSPSEHMHIEHVGKKKTPEHRAKISAAHMGKGHPVTAETRAKISATLKGHTTTAETRANMSAAQKRIANTPEGRVKRSIVIKAARKRKFWASRGARAIKPTS